MRFLLQKHIYVKVGLSSLLVGGIFWFFTSRLRHGLLEGGIGKLLGQLGPVPFFLHGKPQNLKIFEKKIERFLKNFKIHEDFQYF